MKKKLKLELDALTVESFRTADEEAAGPGTVRGHDAPPTRRDTCADTCELTCGDGCVFSGYGSCQPATCADCTVAWTICPTGDGAICCIA